jgi:hypothetical protein
MSNRSFPGFQLPRPGAQSFLNFFDWHDDVSRCPYIQRLSRSLDAVSKNSDGFILEGFPSLASEILSSDDFFLNASKSIIAIRIFLSLSVD